MCATGFLMGPKKQCTNMWHESRRYTTAVYLILIIIVFALAVSKQNIGLILVFLFLEILAGMWYGLSYIPFGRKMVSQFFRSIGICYPCYFVYDATHGQGGNNSLLGNIGGGGGASGAK